MFVVSRYEYLLRLYLAEVLKRVPLWFAWTYYKGAAGDIVKDIMQMQYYAGNLEGYLHYKQFWDFLGK